MRELRAHKREVRVPRRELAKGEPLKELKEITAVIRNLTQARAFTIASDLPAKDMTADSLKSTIETAMGTADGLQYGMIETDFGEGKIMSSEESESIVQYLALRRDVKSIFELEEKSKADQEDAEAEEKPEDSKEA